MLAWMLKKLSWLTTLLMEPTVEPPPPLAPPNGGAGVATNVPVLTTSTAEEKEANRTLKNYIFLCNSITYFKKE